MNENTIIGLYRAELDSQGIQKVDEVAKNMYDLVGLHIDNNIYSYDRYLENGSRSETNVASYLSGNNDKNCIVWCVNHYLGLNRHPQVISAIKSALDTFGTGGGTSAMSGGFSRPHIELKERLEQFLGMDSVILFPTGYTTNLGAISSIASPDDLIVIDRECHASIIDGCKLSGAKFIPFKHNDLADLERKLQRYKGKFNNIYVVVESAYSMSGTLSPLKEIVALKETHDFYLYVDEAHTFGFYGEKGRGYCYELGIEDQVDFYMSTFSKATASVGGFVATKKEFLPIFQFYSSAFIFQAVIPPANVAGILAALDVIENSDERINKLHSLNSYFRSKLVNNGFNLRDSKSPVVPIYIEDHDALFAIGTELFEEGIFSVSVTYPAVKKKEGRLRFIVTSEHTVEQVDRTVEALVRVGRKYGVIDRPAQTAPRNGSTNT